MRSAAAIGAAVTEPPVERAARRGAAQVCAGRAERNLVVDVIDDDRPPGACLLERLLVLEARERHDPDPAPGRGQPQLRAGPRVPSGRVDGGEVDRGAGVVDRHGHILKRNRSRSTTIRGRSGGPTRLRWKVGVPKEIHPGERRVAVVPRMAAKLAKLGLDVAIESGAGTEAAFTDQAYVEAGARIVADPVDAVGRVRPRSSRSGSPEMNPAARPPRSRPAQGGRRI